MKKYLAQFSIVIASSLIVVGIVSAATTISTNISTGGQLTVTGTSTLMGNVGVGTAAPASNVEVQSQTTGASIRIASNADSVTSGAQTITFGTYIGGTFNTTGTLGDTSGVDSDIKIFATQGNLDLGANTGGAATKRLVIGSSGGVTVGNTDLATTTSKFYVNSTSPVVVDTSGNVGIGTVSPSDIVNVVKGQNGTTRITTSNTTVGTAAGSGFYTINDTGFGMGLYSLSSGYSASGLLFPNSGLITTDSSMTSGLVLRTAGTAPIIFGTNNTESMRIINGGNVGIGTTSPTDSLHLYSTTSSVGERIETTLTHGYSFLRLINPGNPAANPVFIGVERDTGGALLTGDTGNALVLVAGATNPIQFGVNNGSTVAMTILSSGNVGIGTTTPVANLQVTAAVNSTTTLEIGRGGSTKGSCVKLYDATGVAWYYTPSVSTGALIATSATSCASVAGF